MNLRRRFILSLAALAALQTGAFAQQPPTPAAALLPVNYRITLSCRDGEKLVGELSSLTCSPKVLVDGSVDAAGISVGGNQIPLAGFVRGNFQDENGIITFTYEIGMQLPVPSSILSNASTGASVATTVQYKDVRCSGTLRMKAGKTYEVFQTGGRTLSLCIAPESEK